MPEEEEEEEEEEKGTAELLCTEDSRAVAECLRSWEAEAAA